ncbi:PHD finger protein-related [Striga asiatica]|uniref:PHD finger protein-related n=1 Tax=Striga asiatica TaxID=4170 RepID=A0A5A7PDW7_STRAF|nr:PHD finger protein-related [Striga asiatica]
MDCTLYIMPIFCSSNSNIHVLIDILDSNNCSCRSCLNNLAEDLKESCCITRDEKPSTIRNHFSQVSSCFLVMRPVPRFHVDSPLSVRNLGEKFKSRKHHLCNRIRKKITCQRQGNANCQT